MMRESGERSLDVMALGARAVLGERHQGRLANINAEAEGIDGKPAFREAFQQRRCLVPVDNFYE
jgi:putative SOS response-associated peptidase YedK